MQRRTALAIINLNLSGAPITTAAAYLVTVPAIWSHNYLRTQLDLLKIEISWTYYAGEVFSAFTVRISEASTRQGISRRRPPQCELSSRQLFSVPQN
jgi:biopolymer transport protein ExbB/TolQ